ncbi:DNA gyrase subunit A [Clostridium butyricum]|uniref:DNA gyrase subunit A n=1 Tax=Clostridium butyricum TaxID=1492 RepID=UPI00325B7CD8
MKKGIVKVLEEEMKLFAFPIIVNNLPSIDGLLNGQRQVLWGMDKAKMNSDGQFYKMLKATGAIYNYYVMGDSGLTGSMKNMGNNYVLNKYLMPKGSFGNKNSRDGKGSAPRYIECKLSKYGEGMLDGIKRNAVTMKDNYDSTEIEPVVLPSKIPNILTNLRISIAVSEANTMPSHNMDDSCNAIISYINTGDIDKSIEILKVPDLPSGGSIIYDKKVFDKIYKTGKGSFVNLGKYKYDKKKNMISIYEIPYNTFIENIQDEIKNNISKFQSDVTFVSNGTDKDGLNLQIYLKNNTNVEAVVQKLRKYTSFESKFACNFTILDLDGKTPMLMNLETIISKWLEHRVNCIKNELNYTIDDKSKLLNRLYGLQLINNDLDKAIKIIRNSKNESTVKEELTKEFNLNKEQVDYISTIRLLNINTDWIKHRVKDIETLEREIKTLKETTNNKEEIDKIIISQLEDVKKKFGKPRQTEIIQESEIQTIKQEDLIEDFTTTLVFTEQQYFKKCRRYSEDQNIKDGDTIKTIVQDSNKSKVLFFSNQGNIYIKNIWELNENKPSNLGQYLPNLLPLETNEIIIGMISTNNYKGDSLIIYPDGHLALINLEKGYYTKQNSTKLKNGLSKKMDLPIYIGQIIDDVEIELTDVFGKTKTISTKDINRKDSRNSQGVTAWNSKKKDWKLTSVNLLK